MVYSDSRKKEASPEQLNFSSDSIQFRTFFTCINIPSLLANICIHIHTVKSSILSSLSTISSKTGGLEHCGNSFCEEILKLGEHQSPLPSHLLSCSVFQHENNATAHI